MLQGHVFIATSLDGFIARENGDIDWLPGLSADGGDYGYGKFIAGLDGLVMGRGSFEKVMEFEKWPYDKPVVVLSRSLAPDAVPVRLAGKVRISDLEPTALAKELASAGWSHAYVDGGKVIQSFLRAGLIEDMVITQVPVLLGAGLPLFGALDQDIALEHLETEAFPSGLVQSRYKVKKPPA